MNVLLYVRPKAIEFFTAVADMVFQNTRIVTYSDYNGIADFWAGKYIYNDEYDRQNDEFEKQVDDILPRCRTLRRMNHDLAYKLARRYWNGMEEFFSEQNFDYLLTIPIDCYTLDIIVRVAERHGVHIISFVGSPFENRAKLTVRGEYNRVRDDVPQEEIKMFVDKMMRISYLSPSEKDNVKQNHYSIYKYYIRRFLIEYFYYPLKKWQDKDPWNYHYNIFEVKGIPFKTIYNKKFESYFSHLKDVSFEREKTVYYPMHLIPEATTEYWCPDIAVTDYNKFILNMIKAADKGITFIIKEHPAMYGRRQLSFYEELRTLPNVILLHPMDRSNNLLLEVDNVVVDNGTVGIEALMRNKRVLVLSDNYYYRFHPNAHLIDRVTEDSLEIPLVEYDNYKFMNNLLEGCFESDFCNSTDGIPQSNPKQMADGIISYLNLNGLPRG